MHLVSSRLGERGSLGMRGQKGRMSIPDRKGGSGFFKVTELWYRTNANEGGAGSDDNEKKKKATSVWRREMAGGRISWLLPRRPSPGSGETKLGRGEWLPCKSEWPVL
jgi:hypothetical protein